MAILKFIGHVGTNKVGSDCEFEFKIDERDLPEDPQERRQHINDIALDALWESGMIDWGYKEVKEGDES